MALREGIVFVVDSLPPEEGLHAFDISEPDRPVTVSFLPLEFGEEDHLDIALAESDGMLAIQSPTSGLFVVDILDPLSPRLLDNLPPPGSEWRGSTIAAMGENLFAMFWDESEFVGLIREFQITEEGLVLRGDYTVNGRPTSAGAQDSRLYTVLWKGPLAYSLLVSNVGNDGKLNSVAEVILPEESPPVLSVSDDRLAVGFCDLSLFRRRQTGVELVARVPVGQGPGACGTRALSWDQTTLVAFTGNGLFGYDVTDLSNPYLFGSYRSITQPWDGAVRESLAVLTHDRGLFVLALNPSKLLRDLPLGALSAVSLGMTAIALAHIRMSQRLASTLRGRPPAG